MANSSASVWLGVTNVGVLAVGTNDYVGGTTGNVFVAKATESFTYDADGNLTSDGRWTNRWDAENRLLSMASHASGPSGSRLDLRFGYDWLSRRVSKVVSNHTGSAWSKLSEQKFIYDGWNVIAILNATNGLELSFSWGSDLSGTLQGAGGIGGLVSMTVHNSALAGTYFYAYDGNANVVALISAADGSIAARYEYDPFGRLLRATGPLAFVNPFRFSTKFQDDESGFLCYLFRFYDPSAGRWLSRDPIGEAGGLNVVGFLGNDAINNADPLGLEEIKTSWWSRAFGKGAPDWIAADGSYGWGNPPRPHGPSDAMTYGGARDQMLEDDGASGFLKLKDGIADTAEFILELTPQNTLSVVVGGESLTGRKAGAGERSMCAATSIPALQLGGKAFRLSGAALKKLNGKTAKEIESILAKECCVVAKNGTKLTKEQLDKLYPRVTPRRGVADEVWERSKAADGKVYAPSGVEIKPGANWELGHKPGHKYTDDQLRAAEEGWDRATWRNYQNDPDIYRPELRPTNRVTDTKMIGEKNA